MIGYRAESDTGRDGQRPARASPREALSKARHAFRIWRRTRPFWGGFLVIVGAGEMLASEQAPIPFVSQVGIRGLGSYLTPIFMLLCGALLWLSPTTRNYHSLVAILLALDSWLTANLGGFFVGMLIGVIGGAMAFAWTRDADCGQPERPQTEVKIRLPSRAVEMPSQLKARRAAPSARPVSTDIPGAMRKLAAARPRRRAANAIKVPVQEALWDLDTPAAPAPKRPRLALPRRSRQLDH